MCIRDRIGYHDKPKISVSPLMLSNDQVVLDSSLEFELSIEGKVDEALLIDYIIYFKKANGKMSPKVFKLKQLNIKRGEKIILSKRHPLPRKVATRIYYPGTHKVSLQINGTEYPAVEFDLII